MFEDVDALLAQARSQLRRVSPAEAYAEARSGGAVLVDIRPEWQRRADGEIAGSVVIERNHLEWRVHPASDARLPVADRARRWIVVCQEGYSSSLAAASLVSLGLDATDLVGGVHAWIADGLPVVPTVTAVEHVVASPE